ncbi:MAG: hypothetical protein IJC11_01620 [Alphaproteobacteria bacterium]|nr:hypothetical protein [Alphaproteobacteria bacterium]MBQ6853954.1 hypothetical protein [Alphaproteobacteria bacterium]MBQ8557590.1 hypothetical protein [Alphaproteobacteria bacterium]
MTKETDELARKIALEQEKRQQKQLCHSTNGYQIAFELLTNLFGCVLIGLSLGLLFQNIFHTSVLLTAGLTVFGGVAGLWSVVRYALDKERKGK